MTNKRRLGPMVRMVLGTGWLLQPFARPLLERRRARGKEEPARLGEKLGYATAERPEGPLVWLHGVGVGEVMALRGLIAALAQARADLRFLVTSSARSSGEVFAANLPPRTVHQYLPLDLPGPVARFLDHWRPDLAVWSDQEVWPRLAVTCARRGIPQAYVAARITDASARARARFGRAYGDLYGVIDRLHAQDAGTAAHLRAMIGAEARVTVSGSLKAAAAPLAALPDLQARLPDTGFVWVAASAHRADIDAALAAQASGIDGLLIVAPRRLEDAAYIAESCDTLGLKYCQRSENHWPNATTRVFIADSFGELGAWYARADAALIGGTFDATEGHNPWEAAALDCAILHGPRVGNFRTDFAQLHHAGAAVEVTSAPDIARALAGPARADLAQMARRARAVREEAATGLDEIVADLLALLAR